jgi:hypothetical protein
MVVKPIKFSLFKFGNYKPVTVLVYFISYRFKTTLLFTVVYTKIIQRGVILSSAKLVLASCNQCHQINHLTLPHYHSNHAKLSWQPHQTTIATSNHPWLPWQHIITQFLYHLLELLTLEWLQHWIVDVKAKRWPYLNVYESKIFHEISNHLSTYRSMDKRYTFWSLSQYHLQVTTATTPGRHGNCITLLWQTHQDVSWQPHHYIMLPVKGYHEYHTWIPWQAHQITRTTT